MKIDSLKIFIYFGAVFLILFLRFRFSNLYLFINDTSAVEKGNVLGDTSPAPQINLAPGEIKLMDMFWEGQPSFFKTTPYGGDVTDITDLGILKIIRISNFNKKN